MSMSQSQIVRSFLDRTSLGSVEIGNAVNINVSNEMFHAVLNIPRFINVITDSHPYKVHVVYYFLKVMYSLCARMLLQSVDPALGRLDYDSLSDQALMEMLFGGLIDESKRRYQDKHRMLLDVCE